MTSEKYPLTGIDTRCIFPGYLGCPNIHCENCEVFHREKFPVPVLQYYRFWFAYLQANNEVPESVSKRRYYSGGGKGPGGKRKPRHLTVISQASADRESNSPRYRVKLSRREAALLKPRKNGLWIKKEEDV